MHPDRIGGAELCNHCIAYTRFNDVKFGHFLRSFDNPSDRKGKYCMRTMKYQIGWCWGEVLGAGGFHCIGAHSWFGFVLDFRKSNIHLSNWGSEDGCIVVAGGREGGGKHPS